MAHDATFRHAIPGSSLTHQMGTFPHEKPPKYVDPDEALHYFWQQLNRKDMLPQIWNLLERGANVSQIARAILYKAAVMGLIQFNLGVVIYPIVGQMIMTIGKAKGIDVKVYPKLRDKNHDMLMNQKLNEKLGNQDTSKPVPFSALRVMPIPKAKDITSDEQKFLQMSIGSQNAPNTQSALPNPAQYKPEAKGLLAKANKGAV